MPETQIKIGMIRESSVGLVRQQNGGAGFQKKDYPRKKNEIKDVVKDLRARYKSILPVTRYGGFR